MAINKIVLNTDTGEQVLVDLTGDNVTAASLVVGSVAHGADGEIVEGANPYALEATNTEVGTQSDLIERIQNALVGKAAGGGTGKPEQEKVIADDITTNGAHTFYPDAGYTMSKVTVNVNVPDVPAVVDRLEVDANGTYKAADEGLDGYSEVVVNVASSGGGENQLHDMLDGSISVIDSNVTKVVEYGCYGLRALKTVNLPEVTNIGSRGFHNCSGILSFNAPKTVTLGSYSLYGCIKLTTVNFPLAEKVLANTFYNCTGLISVDLGAAVSIASSSFQSCSKLEALILRKSDAIVSLSNTNALSGTPIAKGTGYVYVPRTLDDGSDGPAAYAAATNWSTYANQFRAIEDYPDITGG